MTAAFGTSVSKAFVPAHVPSLLALDNDTLGCAIEWRLAEARSHPERDPPYRAADAIARVCARLRYLMLGRSSYWRDIRVCEHTKVDEVKLVLARAGTDFPINIYLEMRNLVPTSPLQTGSDDNFDAYLLAFTVLHRARAIVVTSCTFVPSLDVTSDLVQPADYESRPLVLLSLKCFVPDALLQLVGPRLAQLDLCHIGEPISLDRLEQVMIAASGLKRLTLKAVCLAPTSAAGEHTRLAVPSAALAGVRNRCLPRLVLSDLDNGAQFTDLICRHYPLTMTGSPFVFLSSIHCFHDDSYFGVWVDLETLGSPTHILASRGGEMWNLHFGENRERNVLVTLGRLQQSSLLQTLLRSALTVTPSLEIRDNLNENVSSVDWFEFWCGSTWSQITRLHISLEYADRYYADYDFWLPHEEERIHLPALQTLVVLALHYDNVTKCGFYCAAILDMLDIPSTDIVDIRCDRLNVDNLKKAIDAAHLTRHGYAYFSEDDNQRPQAEGGT